MIRRAALPVVATLVVVAALVALPVTPARAATACSGSTGVTVVVDFNQLGGGVQGTCVEDGGGDVAYDLFAAAGFPVNIETPQNRGYACQVSSKPAGCGLPDGDRYWGLWWADGKRSTWSYSSAGVGSLTVPDGGYVAFAWDEVSGSELPSYTPAAHTTAPSPTPQPSASPTKQPTAPSSSPTRTPTSEPDPSDGPPSVAPTAGSTAPPTPSATPTPTPTETTTPAEPTDTESPTPGATPSDPVSDLADPVTPTAADGDDDGGLPGWLAPLLIVLLFGAAGVALVLKRRQTAP